MSLNQNLYGSKLQLLVIIHAQLLASTGKTITNTSIRDSILTTQETRLIGTDKTHLTQRVSRITHYLVSIKFLSSKKISSTPHRIPVYEFTINPKANTEQHHQ